MTPDERAYVEEDLESDADDRADAQKALANGNVVDEVYKILEAKQFALYDMSGLVYFLKTSGGAVFYWEDEESEDLWLDDKPIFGSKSRPLSTMIITSTLTGDIEFDIRFEGRPVPTSDPILMKRGADSDLMEDDFVEGVRWDEIETTYGKSPSFWDKLRGFRR